MDTEKLLNFVYDQWMLFLALVVIIGLLLRTWISPKLTGAKEVGAQDAVRLLNQDNSIAVDVRLENEFKKGHVPNAIHIPLGSLDSRVRELEKYKENGTVILCCQTGQRSSSASQVLRKHGFSSVFNMAGGLNAWENANLPIERSGKKKK